MNLLVNPNHPWMIKKQNKKPSHLSFPQGWLLSRSRGMDPAPEDCNLLGLSCCHYRVTVGDSVTSEL